MTQPPNNPDVELLAERLLATLRGYGSAAVAFSGGIDSTVVAKAAALALGENAVAVTGQSASLADGELDDARRIAALLGIRHVVISTDEFANPDYARNDGTRCYHCKSELYDRIEQHRDQWQVAVICSGANLDDAGDYRPGLLAAAERSVRHPLQESQMGKREVRLLAQYWELPNWDKPASPCLSSRLAIGVEATAERVARVDAAERFLRGLGLSVLRVRCHADEHARIEVPVDAMPQLLDPKIRQELVGHFHKLGFQFVSLDLEGFRSGGLNVLVPAELLSGAPPAGFRKATDT